MTEQTTLSARTSVTVDATPERAFDVFTNGFASWWPLDSHHIGEQTVVTLEHRGFEVLGERGPAVRDSVSSPGGWVDLLATYAAHLARSH